MPTYANKKACKHMNLLARTRKPAKLPGKSAFPASSHQQVDRSFTGKRVGAALQKAGKPRVNTRLCGDNKHSQPAAPAAQIFMLHAPQIPSSCSASPCGLHFPVEKMSASSKKHLSGDIQSPIRSECTAV